MSEQYGGMFARARIKTPMPGMEVSTIGDTTRRPPHLSAADFDKRHYGVGILLTPIPEFENAAWWVWHQNCIAPYWVDEIDPVENAQVTVPIVNESVGELAGAQA